MSVQEPEVPYRGTGERLRSFAIDDAARERINSLATRYWEIAAYGMLVVFAGVLRFYNLGARAMHHDESLHAYFSYGFKKGLSQLLTFDTWNHDSYKHVPFMHGPFQFIGNGLVMWVFQDGEFQARTLAATMGTALVFLPFLLRKQLGTVGALAAATFIAISPTLLYYSRFTREDIYTAFWTFGIVIFMWRYIASHDLKWLYFTAGFLAMSFATKETTFMTVVAFAFFMDFMFGHYLAERVRAKSAPMSDVRYVGLTIGLIAVAWAVAIGWPFLQRWRERYELEEMPPEADLIIILGSLGITQFAAAVQLLPGFGATWRSRAGDTGDFHVANAEFGVAVWSVFAMIGISTVIGLLWKPRVWLIAAMCFWVPFIVLFTSLGSNYHTDHLGSLPVYNPFPGFFSGTWGSLDYWISQQCERRGDQPDYYYFMTIPVYEFLPLAIASIAAGYYFIRGRLSNALIVGAGGAAIVALLLLPHGHEVLKASGCTKPVQGVSVTHIILPFSIAIFAVLSFKLDHFTRFLIYWVVVTAFALTVAGEKMPWLNVHIALPLAVLAGKFVGDFLSRTDLREDLPSFERAAPYMYAGVASALAILVFVVLGWHSAASIGGWILVAVAAVSVYWAYRGFSRRTAMQVALVGFVAALGVFTLRAGILASWGHPDNVAYLDSTLTAEDHGEVPDELLVYTQTSGDIPALAKKIDEYAKQSGLGKDLPIAVDPVDGYTWPWAWYLRDYRRVGYPSMSAPYTPDDPEHTVILASQSDAANVQVGANYGEPIPYHHRRWFPEVYRGANGIYSTHDFFSGLFSADQLKSWLDFWVRRTLPAEVGDSDGVAYFPADFSGQPAAPPCNALHTEGTQLVIGCSGNSPGALGAPADVALDAAGNIYVADSATTSGRIDKYDKDGNFIASAGGFGSDLKMNQPWSMAVAPDGTVFVADTWDHMILKLDQDLKETKTWGAGCTTAPNCGPLELYGPRKIVVEPSGNVLISDTGNNRLVEYTPDGDFVRQAGGPDDDPNATLKLKEPTGLAVAPNGDVYVADFWHSRIVVLDPQLNQKSEISVPTWGSNQVTDRPYLALLPDGRLLATDPNPCAAPPDCSTPSDGKILVFDPSGVQIASYTVPREEGAQFSRGIGIATDGTNVFVSDSVGNVVRRIPLSEIAP